MKAKSVYWIFTGLFTAFMTLSAIPDIIVTDEALAFITGLGYPKYFIPFIGVAKLLGCIAIVIPSFPRIKEWAYAGLFYDLIGATYSQVANSGFQSGIFFMLLPIGIGTLSYIYSHKIRSTSKI